MNINEALRSVIRGTFRYRGRARRSEFWWWMLLSWCLNMGLNALSSTIDPTDLNVADAISLLLLLPTIAVTVRRLQDVGVSGWVMAGYVPCAFLGLVFAFASAEPGPEAALFVAIPLLLVTAGLAIFIFVCVVQDRTPGPNRFGPDPKGRSARPVPMAAPGQPGLGPADPWGRRHPGAWTPAPVVAPPQEAPTREQGGEWTPPSAAPRNPFGPGDLRN